MRTGQSGGGPQCEPPQGAHHGGKVQNLVGAHFHQPPGDGSTSGLWIPHLLRHPQDDRGGSPLLLLVLLLLVVVVVVVVVVLVLLLLYRNLGKKIHQ